MPVDRPVVPPSSIADGVVPLQRGLFPLFPLVPPSRRIVHGLGVNRKEALQGQEMV